MAKPNGPAKMMVIGEDWCPDVFRGMPVFAKLAEATGIDMRVFKRDENKDIIGEFLKDGEYESIPVAVFYTKDHRYIAHFIERPELAYEEMRTLLVPDVRPPAQGRPDSRGEGSHQAGVHRLPERPGLVELAPGDRPRVHPHHRGKGLVARGRVRSNADHASPRRRSPPAEPCAPTRCVTVPTPSVAYHGCMGSSIKLFRIFGIDIGIHWSWIFIFVIVTWTFATGILDDNYPEWTDAAALDRPAR